MSSASTQQQRTGPIIVGATTTTTSTSTASSAVTASISNSSGAKVHPIGQGANESLAILGSYARSSDNNSKRRRADDINVLDRLVQPLFLRATKESSGADATGVGGEGARKSPKKRRENVESGENNASGDDSDAQSVAENDITITRIEHHKQLNEELLRRKQQNQLLMNRRNNVFKSMVALHELYETGLDGIARMNDLRFVPDNVMPNEVPR